MGEDLVKYGGSVGAVLVGIVYFMRAGRSALLARRILCAAYAPATAVLFTLGVCLAPLWVDFGRHSFALAQAPVALLAGLSFVLYPGRASDHVVLGPIAALCWFWQYLIGELMIYGK